MRYPLFAALLATAAAVAAAPPHLTLYQGELALVREARVLLLPAGRSEQFVDRLPRRLVAESLRLDAGPDVRIVARGFTTERLTPQRLLEAHVGRELELIRDHPTTGEEWRQRATLLAVDGDQVVVRIGERIETGARGAPWRFAFEAVPDGLVPAPRLRLVLEGAAGGRQPLTLDYLTDGLGWQADYVARLAADGGSLELEAWASLANRSGVDFIDARVALVAGALNRVAAPRPMPGAEMQTLAARGAGPPEALAGYHLYPLRAPITLYDGERRQVSLRRAAAVPVTRRLIVRGAPLRPFARPQQSETRTSAELWLELDNRAPGLGEPLPAGTVRVYRETADGPRFLGEDRIAQTAVGERIRLVLGRAAELIALRRQTALRKLHGDASESAWRIELINGAAEAAVVDVIEQFGGDWSIVASNHPHERVSADEARWRIEVPGDGRRVLEFRVHHP